MAELWTHDRRRALFDNLLVAPLDRAFAFEQVHDATVMVAEHLHLHVVRPFDLPFDVERAVAERRNGLASGRLNRIARLGRGADESHALPTAAS